MSDTKHTPGPLQYCFEGSTAAFIVEADGTVVAKLSVLENSSGHSALVANTRLFAAAPELLEAAEGIVSRWDSPLWKDQPHTGIFIDRLRAAIAKAKGELP